MKLDRVEIQSSVESLEKMLLFLNSLGNINEKKKKKRKTLKYRKLLEGILTFAMLTKNQTRDFIFRLFPPPLLPTSPDWLEKIRKGKKLCKERRPRYTYMYIYIDARFKKTIKSKKTLLS